MPVARAPASRSNTITPYGARREQGRTSPSRLRREQGRVSPSRLLRRRSRGREASPEENIIELLHHSVDRALEVEHLDAPPGSRLGWSARGTNSSRNSHPSPVRVRATPSHIESPPLLLGYLGEGPRSPEDELRSPPRVSRRPSSPAAQRLEALVGDARRRPPEVSPHHRVLVEDSEQIRAASAVLLRDNAELRREIADLKEEIVEASEDDQGLVRELRRRLEEAVEVAAAMRRENLKMLDSLGDARAQAAASQRIAASARDTEADLAATLKDKTVRQRELAEAMVRERKEGHAITQRAAAQVAAAERALERVLCLLGERSARGARRRAFKGWASDVLRVKVRRVAALAVAPGGAERRVEKVPLRAAMAAWEAETRAGNSRAAAAMSLVIMLTRALLQRSLLRWALQARSGAMTRRLAESSAFSGERVAGVLAKRRAMRTRRRVLAEWHAQADASLRARRLLARSARLFCGHTSAIVFRVWGDAVARRGRAHRLCAKATAIWVGHSEGAVFRSWSDAVKSEKEERLTLSRAAKFWRKFLDAHAFRTWAGNTKTIRQLRRIGGIVARHWQAGCVGHALRTWITDARRKRVLRKVAGRVAHCVTESTLSATFRAWRFDSIGTLRMRNLSQRAADKGKGRVLKGSLEKWVDTVGKQKRVQGVLSRAVAIMTGRAVVQAFLTWVDNMEELRKSRRVFKRIALLLSSHTVATALNTWITFVADVKTEKLDAAAEKSELEQAREHDRLQALVNDLEGKCVAAQEQRALAVMQHAARLFGATREGPVLLAWVLQEWLEVVESVRALVARADFRLLKRVWAAWRPSTFQTPGDLRWFLPGVLCGFASGLDEGSVFATARLALRAWRAAAAARVRLVKFLEPSVARRAGGAGARARRTAAAARVLHAWHVWSMWSVEAREADSAALVDCLQQAFAAWQGQMRGGDDAMADQLRERDEEVQREKSAVAKNLKAAAAIIGPLRAELSRLRGGGTFQENDENDDPAEFIEDGYHGGGRLGSIASPEGDAKSPEIGVWARSASPDRSSREFSPPIPRGAAPAHEQQLYYPTSMFSHGAYSKMERRLDLGAAGSRGDSRNTSRSVSRAGSPDRHSRSPPPRHARHAHGSPPHQRQGGHGSPPHQRQEHGSPQHQRQGGRGSPSHQRQGSILGGSPPHSQRGSSVHQVQGALLGWMEEGAASDGQGDELVHQMLHFHKRPTSPQLTARERGAMQLVKNFAARKLHEFEQRQAP